MKIIGLTVGTPLPKPNFDQTDPRKGDYIRGDRSFLNAVKTTEQHLTAEEQAQVLSNLDITHVTNEEIDAICGQINNEVGAEGFNNFIVFVDHTTNIKYKVYVDNGKLCMVAME